MIIVVGADNTGKTTLVKHIVEKFGIEEAPRYHTLPPEDYVDWYRWVMSELARDREVVIDRFFIDEFVYGPVKRGQIGLTGNKMESLKNMFNNEKPLIILCHVSTDQIKKTFAEREQYPDLSEIPAIQKAFVEVLKEWPFCESPQVVFSYTKDEEFKGIDRHIDNYLKARRTL